MFETVIVAIVGVRYSAGRQCQTVATVTVQLSSAEVSFISETEVNKTDRKR